MEENYTIEDIEFLISTQNKDSLDFLNPIFSHQDLNKINVLIINQTSNDHILKSVYENIRVINVFETGVAKSRNLALENAKGKIVVFADDDVNYLPNTLTTIVETYNKHERAAAILFQIQKNNTALFKKYPKNYQDPISNLTMLNCGTIEITLKNSNSEVSRFRFDERFGINAPFAMGDEPLFLMDLKKRGKRVVFVNKTIVEHAHESTGTKSSFEKYFGLGAFYKQMFPNYHLFWLFLKLLFDLKQNKIALTEIKKALNFAKQGRQKLTELTTKTIK